MQQDSTLMCRALELAQLGTGRVSPNPLVGCVITSPDGTILGEGAHLRHGKEHAEANAVIDAIGKGHSLKGATAYVTLEPCAHYGKTAPCAELLIHHEIARCVVAMTDPYEMVNGKGIEMMRQAGILVEVGLLESEARELNRFFIHYATTHRPYVTLKIAQSLDGRSALANGESRWITSEASRRKVHQMRATFDAVLIGSGTALLDDPELTVRLVEGRQPQRIVLDRRLTLPTFLRLFTDDHHELTTVITSRNSEYAAPGKIARLADEGVRVLSVDMDERGLDLKETLRVLAEQRISSILVEPGPRLAASFIQSGLADELVFFIAPMVLGGDASPAVGPLELSVLGDSNQYGLHSSERVEGSEDLCITLRKRA